MRITFTLKEIGSLILSVFVLGVLFSFNDPKNFLQNTLIVGISFIAHELAHKFMAEHYDCKAEYVIWPRGILMSLLLGLLSGGTFIFAAVGYVMISSFYKVRLGYHYTELTLEEIGKINLAGPLTNAVLAVIFMPFSIYGSFLNFVLAMFNLLPFPPLDGSKIFMWSRIAWLSSLAGVLSMFALSFIHPIVGIIGGTIISIIVIFKAYFKGY